MHEIFICYSSKHRECARELADAIEAQYGEGSVWWEHELEARASHREQIGAALEAARVVVVLWTEGAPVSAEAQRAFAANKLVNVRPEDIGIDAIPDPFNAHHIDEASDRDGILATIAKVWNGVPATAREPLDEIDFRLEPKLEKLPTDARHVLPSELLQARYAVTPYIDATGAKADCVAWCLSGERAAGRLIHGPGGFGKTRLMIEAAAELRDHGWTAGFFDCADKQQALEQCVLHEDDAGLLLVVDDAEGRQREVVELAALLANAAGSRPLRLVLLARSGGDWWERLRDEHPEVQRLFRRDAPQVDAQALQLIANADQRRALFQDAVRAFWPVLAKQGVPKPSQPPADARLKLIWDGGGFERPLAIQMEALLWLCSASPAETGVAAQLKAVLGLEHRHWEKLCGALDDDAQRDLARGAAQVTLVGGTQTQQASESLLLDDDFYTGGRAARSDVAAPLANLAEVYGRGEGLAGIEPNLVGEHFAAMTADDEMIHGALRWIERQPEEEHKKRRCDLIATLQRATLPEHGPAVSAKAVERLDWLIRNRMAELASDIAAVMADMPGRLQERVQCAAEDLDFNALRALDFALPFTHPKLLELALSVSRRHAALAKTALHNAEADEQDAEILGSIRSVAAAAMHQFGIRLSALGNQEEALAASREAADIYRRLAGTRPDDFLPRLAGSLNNLGIRLSNLGRREEALTAAREATDIRRRLAKSRPDEVFLLGLAGNLNNLGAMFSALGRREEALAAASETADLYRRLAVARPDAFLPYLATSVNNLGNRLSELGRREEALAAASEAVEVYRRLAERRPDAFLPDLAMNLNNLGNRRAELGRREEALSAVAEAVDIYRRLAEAHADAFLPSLARSLNNLGIWYSDLGRHHEALAASREAVALQRTLSETRQERAILDLAKCLGAESQILGAMEQNDEAAASAAEALTIMAPFVETFPQAFAPLAQILGRLYMNASEASAAPQDNALLERVGKAIMLAMKDEERAEAEALLAAAKNEAATAEEAAALDVEAKEQKADAPAGDAGAKVKTSGEPDGDAGAKAENANALEENEVEKPEKTSEPKKAESTKAEAAGATGEDALALLPPHLAEQLRAARSPRKQTEPADG